MNKMSQSKQGFTLIELLVASAILTVAILATAFSVLSVERINDLSREKEIALNDANRVLESMRDLANDSLIDFKARDWNTWASNNIIAVKGANDVALQNEAISVSYIDQGNPVRVRVTVTWDHEDRQYSYQTVSFFTDRG